MTCRLLTNSDLWDGSHGCERGLGCLDEEERLRGGDGEGLRVECAEEVVEERLTLLNLELLA